MPRPPAFLASAGERSAAALFIGFVLVTAMFGGASRGDALSQIVVRTLAIAFAAAALVLARREGWRTLRPLLVFLLLLAALIAVQLVPLPPSVWMALPGRSIIAEAAPLAGIEQPWRPISMSPDETINSLLALLPGFAALLLYANLPRDRRLLIVNLLLGVVMLSAIMGLAQITTQASWLYPYRITNDGTAVGLFANRNHQGLLLSMSFPLLATIASYPRHRGTRGGAVQVVLMMIALFMVPLILATGSRAGFIAMLLGMLGGQAILIASPRSRRDEGGRGRRRLFPPWVWLLVAAVVAVAVIAAIQSSRAEALQRLFERDLAEDKRVLAFRPMIEMAQAYFPVGTGFGAFPDVFRFHEPFDNLALTYMNHAHNDLLEIVIEGGAVAVALIAAFLIWFVGRSYAAWRGTGGDPAARLLARLGSVLLGMMLLASLADYPLRTPTMSVVFVLACCWLVGERVAPIAPAPAVD